MAGFSSERIRIRMEAPLNRSKGPASFAWFNLTKILIIESKSHQVKKGDGIDFCHAVMGSAFAKFAALDNNWKRRVEALPKPNGLARIYGPQELDQMVTDIELALKHLAATL